MEHNYLIAAALAILLIGVAGFVDNCRMKTCCESYFSQAVGLGRCQYGTFRDSRPLSLELAIIGLFLTVGVFATIKTTHL